LEVIFDVLCPFHRIDNGFIVIKEFIPRVTPHLSDQFARGLFFKAIPVQELARVGHFLFHFYPDR
jgi:hypothetical protein